MGIPITDPVELAWCEFARHREKTWRAITAGEQGLSIASFEAGAKWQAARIRGELLAEISVWRGHQATARQTERSIGANTALAVFTNALDRIIPEER